MSNLQQHKINPYAAVSNARKAQARAFLSRPKVETTHVCIGELPVACAGVPPVFRRADIKNPLEAAGEFVPHGTYAAHGISDPRSAVPSQHFDRVRL